MRVLGLDRTYVRLGKPNKANVCSLGAPNMVDFYARDLHKSSTAKRDKLPRARRALATGTGAQAATSPEPEPPEPPEPERETHSPKPEPEPEPEQPPDSPQMSDR